MIYKQHREIETSLSLVLCCLFSYSKILRRLEGVAYKLLLINHTACIFTVPERSRCVLGVGVGAVREDDLLEVPVPHHAVDAC